MHNGRVNLGAARSSLPWSWSQARLYAKLLAVEAKSEPPRKDGDGLDIRIIRSQEPRKGMLGGTNVRLAADIAVTLEPAEQELVARYYDPFVPWHLDESGGEPFKALKVDQTGSSLSKFRVHIHTDEGFDRGGLVQAACDTIVKALRQRLVNLIGLASWQGEEVIAVHPVADALAQETA